MREKGNNKKFLIHHVFLGGILELTQLFLLMLLFLSIHCGKFVSTYILVMKRPTNVKPLRKAFWQPIGIHFRLVILYLNGLLIFKLFFINCDLKF